jgi:hypothetical protein
MEAMRYLAATVVVSIALALPAWGQHGAGHGGSSGHGGFASHSGFAGHTGFAGRSGFSGSRGAAERPGAPFRNGGFARPGMGRAIGPLHSGFRVPYRGNGTAQFRPPYRPGFGSRSRGGDRDRRRGPWLGYGYPGYPGYLYPYPYVIDPGFYDWGISGDSAYDGDSAYGQGGAAPGYAPYTDYGDAYPETPQAPYYAPQPYAQSPGVSAPAPVYPGTASLAAAEEPLTLIFKSGRAPQKMQNYIMNTKALTDLDPQHYEQIPLDQIDIAATEQANRARGVDFQVPGARQE